MAATGETRTQQTTGKDKHVQMPDLEGFDLPVERLWLEWGRVYSWRDAKVIKVSITTQEAAGLLKWRLNALNLWL